jgi:hypothetical protein
MTIGPEPMRRIVWRSSRRGMEGSGLVAGARGRAEYGWATRGAEKCAASHSQTQPSPLAQPRDVARRLHAFSHSLALCVQACQLCPLVGIRSQLAYLSRVLCVLSVACHGGRFGLLAEHRVCRTHARAKNPLRCGLRGELTSVQRAIERPNHRSSHSPAMWLAASTHCRLV